MDINIQVPLDPTEFDIFKKVEVFKSIPWLRYRLFGNELYDYALALASFLTLWMGFRALRWLLLRRLLTLPFAGAEADAEKSLLKELAGQVWKITLPLMAFSLAARKLDLNAEIAQIIKVFTVSVLTAQVVSLASTGIGSFLWRQRARNGDNSPGGLASTQNIVTLSRVGLWTAGVLFCLDNIGVNISTFVAGLGIGGVAIALAAQAVLGDTFSSFAIAMDKAFEVGDFISIDGLNGTVEHVGFKTTRVRSLSGELLVFSNSDMTKSRIRNFRKMVERRVHFQLGVTYQTSAKVLAEIPELLKSIIETEAKCRFERASFLVFGESSLNFDVVFWVLDPDYLVYAATHQAINLKIVETFAARGIDFAYPTRTLFLTPGGLPAASLPG